MGQPELAAALDRLKKVVFPVVSLTDDEWKDFANCWHPVDYKRKTVLTAAGEVERFLYFVVDGVQRAYFVGDSKRDATLIFSYSGSMSGIIDSFQLQRPSLYYLETLTASRLLRLSFADFNRLLATYPNLERWGRIGTAAAMSGLMERYIELMTYTAEEKFRVLLTRSPHVLQLIPHKYLASYLALDPTTFSKLLATVKL
ncbi:Crp/Fnr family transcriptional regulator [Larkinella terrae]|uniref:Cyclic nucleotide-binding domain-containing protein n=1 Tax=Larkinella terrae TaxID=2025311 RepID=A0A7K0EMA9_9BACT|nr:cyclic nucleotide-binding domain-containing protein [Larkinella terrae]MRS62934.1 cyclic nucleotide-binding domain-containing protein [Larkinella terrae]